MERKTKKKRNHMVLLCIILVLLMLAITIYVWSVAVRIGFPWFSSLDPIHHGAVPSGYTGCEEHYEDGFMNYTDYCKYFYTQENDDWFALSERYKKVMEQDIRDIKGYFSKCGALMESQARGADFDFDSQYISEGDYVYIDTREGEKRGEEFVYEKYDCYSVYLYDKESHTLFYVHNNN